MQVFSLQETHVFSPEILNTATSDSPGRRLLWLRFLWPISRPGLSFVTGEGPGGIVVGGGATTTANGSITSAGPNNAAGVWNHRNLFTYQDTLRDHQRNSPDQRRRLVPAHSGQRRQRFAAAWPGHLYQPDDISAGNGQQLSSCARCTRNWVGEACLARGSSRIPSVCGTILRCRPESATNSPRAGMKPTAGPPITLPMRMAF